MGADPRVLARAGQPGHHGHRRPGVVVGRVVRVAVRLAEEPEPRVVGREVAGTLQAPLLGAVLAVQGDVVHHLGGVTAAAPQDVGGRQQRQVVVACDQAHPERDRAQVGAFQGPERHLVVADQSGDVLAPPHLGPALPEQAARHEPTPAGVPVGGDPAVRLPPGTRRLADVVQEHGREEPDPLGRRARPPPGQLRQGLARHPRVRLHVALGVVDRILLHTRHLPHPREGLSDRRPVQRPGRGSRAQLIEQPHGAPPGRRGRWLSPAGRASASPSPARRW